MGDEYAWRSADGSGNNITDPDLGKAGNPYARSVAQSNPLAYHQMPDPGLIFDTLLRRDKVSILFYHPSEKRANPTSSQFSLSHIQPAFHP